MQQEATTSCVLLRHGFKTDATRDKQIGNVLRSLLPFSVISRCNIWMLLIVKLLSFKRYNYPFYKCRESGRQMQCAYSQSVSDKVVPLLFSLFCKILETNAMHCFSASSVSCVTERLSGCKDTDLYWIRANYYLKKYYSTVAFFDNFNRTTSCITVNELQTMGNFIVKVPLQTIHELEVIWNDNSDKQDERLR